MAPNVDKLRQQQGVTPPATTTPQPVAETKPAASQPIDMTAAGSQKEVPKTAASQPIDMTGGGTRTQEQTAVQPQPQEEKSYTVKKGDTLWAVAKQMLIDSGISRPTNGQIMDAMNLIAKANGCNSVEECRDKFFNKTGSTLNLTGLSVVDGQMQYAEPVQSKPTEQTIVLNDEEKQLANKLKEKYPDLELDKMSDAEMKKMLDNFRENKPDVIAALQKEITAAQTDAPQQDSSTQVDAEQLIKEKLGDVEITADNINSDDIKAKLEEFMKNASPDEIKAIAEYLHKSGVVSDIIPIPQQADEIQSSVREYISANPDATKPVGGTVDKSELEILAEQTGLGDNFDEIIAEIKVKAKTNPNSLTKTEAELLEKYDAQVSGDKKEDDVDIVKIAKKVMESGFLKKTPEEQMQILAKMALKGNKEYEKMSPEEQKQYLAKTMQDIMEMAKEGITGDSAKEKQQILIRAMVLIGISKKENITIEQLKQMPSAQRDEKLQNAENKVLNATIKVMSQELGDMSNLSYVERVDKYADAILNLTDSEYGKITDSKKKEEYRNKKIEEYAAQMGIDLSDPNTKKAAYTRFAITLERIINKAANAPKGKEISIAQEIRNYNNSSIYEKNKDLIAYIQSIPENQRTKEQKLILDQLELENSLLKGLPDNATCGDVLKNIEDRLNNPQKYDLSDIDIKRLEGLKKCLERQIEVSGGNRDIKFDTFLTNKDRLNIDGRNVKNDQEAADVALGGVNKDNYRSEKMRVKINKFIEHASPAELMAMREKLLHSGLSESEVDEILNNRIDKANWARIMSRVDSPEQMNAMFGISNILSTETTDVTKNTANAVSGWEGLNTRAAMSSYTVTLSESPEVLESLYTGAYQNLSNEDIVAFTTDAGKSDKMSDAGRANVYKTAVTAAPDDNTKLYMGRELSSRTDNAAALEGLAAASDSIQDQGIRSQYNSHVETAASNLPPTEQAKVKTAMQTGQISQETLSKTSTSSSSAKSQAQQTSQNSNTQTTTNPTSQRQGSAQAQGTAQNTQAAQAQQNQARAAAQQAAAQQAAQLRQQAATNPMTFGSSSTVSGSSSVSSSSTTSTSSTSSTSSYDDADSVVGYTKAEAQAIAQADEEKRLELMQKVQELKTDIDNSIEEWEARHRKLTTEEGDVITAGAAIDAAIEAINSSAYTPSEKEELKSRIIKATSIDEIYEILVSKSVDIVHVKDKILDLLSTSGSGTSVRNVVAEVIGDDTVVKELFLSTSSTSVKKELLNLMSPDTVVELLASKQISNIADVDHKILRTFLEKNIYSMSNTEFNEYLKHLPLDDRMALVEMRNNARGITAKMNVPAGEAHSADMPSPVSQDEELPPASGQNSPLGKGEMSRTLADGSVITRQGSGFGAVSDTDFDTYQVLSPDEVKRQQGAPIGMDDEILTVGSAEWNMKYNRNNVQTTAFTLNAMDENDEDDGIGNIMSTKGNFKGTRIKKKYKPGGFNAMG